MCLWKHSHYCPQPPTLALPTSRATRVDWAFELPTLCPLVLLFRLQGAKSAASHVDKRPGGWDFSSSHLLRGCSGTSVMPSVVYRLLPLLKCNRLEPRTGVEADFCDIRRPNRPCLLQDSVSSSTSSSGFMELAFKVLLWFQFWFCFYATMFYWTITLSS